ncbi:MAG: hypothetical protein JXA10_04180, partial [Anaerolineae bacterium]|nr:hypothetical protein [Anaerolineae bacterium]
MGDFHSRVNERFASALLCRHRRLSASEMQRASGERRGKTRYNLCVISAILGDYTYGNTSFDGLFGQYLPFADG